MKATLLALTTALAVAGCDAEPVTAETVIPILTADPMSLVADGRAQSKVTVCSVAQGRKAGLKATLTLSGAKWVNGDEATLEAPLAADGCGSAWLVAPQALGPVHLRAELQGFERNLDSIALTPTPVTDLLLSTSDLIAPGKLSRVQVTVRGQVAGGGAITLGTTFRFEVRARPEGSAYLTAPAVVITDPAATNATTTIEAGSALTSLDLDVSVLPPGATLPSKTESFPIPILE